MPLFPRVLVGKMERNRIDGGRNESFFAFGIRPTSEGSLKNLLALYPSRFCVRFLRATADDLSAAAF